ncbi:hypothetical protein, partial [Paraburkholderia caribensis]|uniref:hypothetical protein n=1 Tax=Paraburkholderia caribensis TaxID=75105 RepID=UPI0034D2D88A
TQFATWAAADCLAWRAVTRAYEAGEAYREGVGNAREQVRCHVKDGDVGGPWIRTRAGGVSRFLLPTFLCGGKEK